MATTITSPAREQTSTARRSALSQLVCIAAWVWLIFVSVAFMLLDRKSGQGHGFAIFGTYWESGRAAAHGLNPYVVYPNTYLNDYSRIGVAEPYPDRNLNPPIALPYFQALSHLSLKQTVIFVTITASLCFSFGTILIASIRPEIQGRQVLWLIASTPASAVVSSGQVVYAWLFLLAAIIWYLQKRGYDSWSSVVLGILIAIKPTMILWPVFLLAAGYYRYTLRAIATATVAFFLPMPFYGITVYREWMEAISHDLHWVNPADIAFIPFFKRLGNPYIGIAFAILVYISAAIWAYKRKPRFLEASGIGILLAILCAPLGWADYVLFAAPFFVDRIWKTAATLVAIAFLIRFSEFATIPAYLDQAAVLLMLLIFIKESPPHRIS